MLVDKIFKVSTWYLKKNDKIQMFCLKVLDQIKKENEKWQKNCAR